MLRGEDNMASTPGPAGEAHGIGLRRAEVGLLQGERYGTGLPRGAGRLVPEPAIQN